MRTSRREGRRIGVLALTGMLAFATGCDEADVSISEIDIQGRVAGQVVLDLDGDSVVETGSDFLVPGLPLRLELPNGARLAVTTTDDEGEFAFEEVPAGLVTVVPDPEALGDSLAAFGDAGFGTPVEIDGVDDPTVNGGLIYPVLTIPEARARPPGDQVFTTGLALNDLSGGVNVLHVAGDGFLRITDILGGGIRAGDSVRVRGVTAREAGQPVLRLGEAFDLGPTIVEIQAIRISTATADRADDGTLDAAFVRVDTAEVVSFEDLDLEGIRVVVDDGSGPLDVIFRESLGVDPDDVTEEGATVLFTRLRGLLVPRSGPAGTRWTLRPRNGSDFRIEIVDPGG